MKHVQLLYKKGYNCMFPNKYFKQYISFLDIRKEEVLFWSTLYLLKSEE